MSKTLHLNVVEKTTEFVLTGKGDPFLIHDFFGFRVALVYDYFEPKFRSWQFYNYAVDDLKTQRRIKRHVSNMTRSHRENMALSNAEHNERQNHA